MFQPESPFRGKAAPPSSILIVDDDEVICEVLSAYLRPKGYRIRVAHTGAAASEALRSAIPDVVILDLRLPDMPGQEILRRIRERQLECEVIIITGFASLDSALEAIKSGAFDYIVKPFKLGEIEISVRNAVDRIRLRRQNRLLTEKVKELTLRLERGQASPASPTIRFEEIPPPPPLAETAPGPPARYGEPPDRKTRSNT
ncbi:MAG: response regulator [Deltaproteobacteria bacterium]|nr:response regulator [Deltaproteobacteria bacterium]